VSYATVAQFQSRYDSRVIAQLSNDANGSTVVTATVQACLDDATATINAAALQGSQYTVTQLTDLVATGDTMLVRICCDVALEYIAQRRSMGLSGRLESQVKRSMDLLESLRLGQRIFNIADNRSADLPSIIVTTADQSSNLGLMSSLPFFGGAQATKTTAG
jgi:phage gp36-like protein